MLVVRNQQDTVSDGYAEQRDEADQRGDADDLGGQVDREIPPMKARGRFTMTSNAVLKERNRRTVSPR